VIADLVALRGAPCTECGRVLCGHEALISRAMGFLAAPRCLACLARGLGRPAGELRDEVHAYLMHQACLRQGWKWANHQEGQPASMLPACLWSGPGARGDASAAQPASA
jgi:hypothetical protein